MSRSESDKTCEECMLYDGMCQNKESDHFQHVLGILHPACDDGHFEVNRD